MDSSKTTLANTMMSGMSTTRLSYGNKSRLVSSGTKLLCQLWTVRNDVKLNYPVFLVFKNAKLHSALFGTSAATKKFTSSTSTLFLSLYVPLFRALTGAQSTHALSTIACELYNNLPDLEHVGLKRTIHLRHWRHAIYPLTPLNPTPPPPLRSPPRRLRPVSR